MGEPASFSTILPPEARPPTPPRDSERNDPRSSFLGRIFSKDPSSRRSSASSHQTPPDSSLESPNTTSGSIRKKVGWAESADYSEPPVISFNGEGFAHSVQPLPPSAERKPTKSILKASNASQEHDSIGSNTKLLPPHQHPNFATMLESIVQQLAGNDRTSKIDAYLMLSSSLKASDNVPDIKALRNKMSLLCQFVSQDLNSKVENGKPDSAMIVNAIMLLASFLQKGAIADSLPSEFQINVIEYTIKAFADGSASKEVVRHLMFVLAQQNFSAKVMNQDRVSRLITALHNVETQVKGKSIVTGRLQAYRNLLRRSKAHMLANTAWMEDLFVDMRSSNKDVRNSAITFGLESSFHLGTESGAARAMSELFKMEHSEGICFAEFYAACLKTMVKKKEEGPAVPQIWSVIVLFLRAKPQLYEQWTFMKLFLDVLSQCWNSSDVTIKNEANYAWNRFIFAVHLGEKTSPSTRAMLLQPLSSQIKQRKSQIARKSAMNSIYHLLYYAFSPMSTPSQLDTYWDEYIAPLMTKCLITDDLRGTSEVGKSDINEACTILRCLFDTSTQRPWSENRVIENTQQNIMSPKELPALDPKWLRNRVSKVSPILSSLLERVYWELGGDDSPITKLWQTYVKTIALPAKMEVKVSNDTMNCIASLFGILHRIWTAGRFEIASLPQSKGPHSPNTTAAFLRSFEKIISTAIEALGPLAFTEKLLSISQNTFIAVATPSHQPRKIKGEIKCPLDHLFLFLMAVSPDLEYDQRFSSMIYRILLPFFEARKSSTSKKEFVKGLFNLLPIEPTEQSVLIWQALAELGSIAIDLREKNDNIKSIEEPLGANYRETIKILEAGIRYSPLHPLPGWKLLFEALVTSATIDAGDAGRAVAVIELLANVLIPKDNDHFGLGYLHVLLTKASYPKDRQALDIARKRMWGTANSTQKAGTFDPYASLYDYIQLSLETAYTSFSKQNTAAYAEIIAGTSNLLGRCPTSLLLGALTKLQNGIAHWISDAESHLTGGNGLSQAILTLWSTVCTSITQILQSDKHTKVLNELEVLICCGLESKHKTIVTSSVKSWNITFGSCNEHLNYPDRIKAALTRLHPIADISLPFFPDSLEFEVSANQAQLIEFAETQNDSTIYPGLSSSESILKLRPSRVLASQISPTTRRLRQTTPQVILPSLRSSSKRSREPTPDNRGRTQKKRDTTPRARHDDSQVEFEAVPSSPITDRIVDSQLLTEKQKETRERQNADAAMFPDLRSSPRIKDMKGKAGLSEDPELPRHRSRSRSRSMHSPEAPRETTPTLVAPSDDDQFIVSSPTPKRSTRDTILHPDPPSSPPESAIKKRPILNEDFTSSPESAPEGDDAADLLNSPNARASEAQVTDIEEEVSYLGAIQDVDGNQSSLDPSAQINPFAISASRVSSTWESSGENQRASSPVDDPSDQLRADASQHHAENLGAQVEEVQLPSGAARSAEVGSAQKKMAEAQVFDAANDPELPGTPVHSRQASPLMDKTPRTPQFVDAPTSPSSSDPNVMNEDVFEDAVSSPRPNMEEKTEKTHSSPLSDIDETSMLRIMAEFDQGFSRATKQVTFFDQKEDGPHDIVPVSSSLSNAGSPVQKSSFRETPLSEQMKQDDDKEQPDTSPQLQTSSIPSLIPETPGMPAAEAHTPLYDDDGEEVDMSQTILVDASSLENGRYRIKRRAGRLSSRKRKHQDITDIANEVPDSQDVGSQLEVSTSPQKRSPTKNISPAKKKRKERHQRRASQANNENEPSFEDDPLEISKIRQGQDLTSMDVDEAEGFDNNPTEDHVASPIQQSVGLIYDEAIHNLSRPTDMEDERVIDEQIEDEVQANGEDEEDREDDEMSKGHETIDKPGVEAVEETSPENRVVEISNSAHAELGSYPQKEIISDSSPLIAISEPSAPVEVPISEDIVVSESAAAAGGQTRDENVQEQPGVAARMIESVKNRLRSVIGDLNLLGLGRRDTLELEDLFMDGKRALYTAESRGRGSGD